MQSSCARVAGCNGILPGAGGRFSPPKPAMGARWGRSDLILGNASCMLGAECAWPFLVFPLQCDALVLLAIVKQQEIMYLRVYIYKSNIFVSPHGGNEPAQLICLHIWHSRLYKMHFRTKITRPLPATNEAMPFHYRKEQKKKKKEKKTQLCASAYSLSTALQCHSFPPHQRQSMLSSPGLGDARRPGMLFASKKQTAVCTPELIPLLTAFPRHCKRPPSAFAPCPAQGSHSPVQSDSKKSTGDLFVSFPSRSICMTIS